MAEWDAMFFDPISGWSVGLMSLFYDDKDSTVYAVKSHVQSCSLLQAFTGSIKNEVDREKRIKTAINSYKEANVPLPAVVSGQTSPP